MRTNPTTSVSFRILSLVLLLALLAGACGQAPATPQTTTEDIMITRGRSSGGPRAVSSSGSPGEETPAPGLRMRLSEGSEVEATPEPVTLAPAEPLDPSAVSGLLARLPALPTDPADYTDFAVRPTSLPAPRTGATVKEPFPPPATPEPAEVTTGPLEVLRYAPEGDVPLAPNLNITFNQAMVPLTGLSDLAAGDVPVKLSPMPPGQWRWVGTRTLTFEPDGRFPMATGYTVEIPAGTTSATGNALAEAVTWTFTTPPPQMERGYPQNGPQPLEPLLFVRFDQAINPEAVLEFIALVADGTELPIRLATTDEIEADEAVRRLAEDAAEGRWLAFRAIDPLPGDTLITVQIKPGTPSAEGPLTTQEMQSFSFRTYGPLQVTEHRCGWDNQCPPFSPWTIIFSNPLDEEAFQESHIAISPELPAANVNVYGNRIQITGRSSGNTRYEVTLGADIRDIFGQTLGRETILTFSVGEAEPVLWMPGEQFVTLDPASRPILSVYSINYRSFKLRAYAVTPDDYSAFKRYAESYYRNEQGATPPGREVMSRTVPVESPQDQLAETIIDLSPALTDNLGHLYVVIEPDTSVLDQLFSRRGRPQPIIAWVQATRIGLDAFVDQNNMIAWANALEDGSPLEGVSLSLLPGDRQAETDADGLAIIPLPDGKEAAALVARLGNDVAMLPAYTYIWADGGWQRRPMYEDLRWYVFDDRGMYRPGEEVHVKGWVRRVTAGVRGDIEALSTTGQQVTYSVRDAQGNQVLTGETSVGSLGGFDLAFTLDDTMNLGYTTLELSLGGKSYYHNFQVQEFRRPEYEVEVSASEGPHFVGESATAEVSANYYAGGALPNADVNWVVRSSPGHYAPPGWDDFTFGKWIPWWGFYYERAGFGYWGGPETTEEYTAQTDAAGIHRLRIDFESVEPPEPKSVTAEATVMDVNRQAWTASASLLVHPSELYVGLRTEVTFVERTEPIPVDAIVTDLDGNAIAGRAIEIRAARLEWKHIDGEWQEVEADVQTCTADSADEPVTCTFETPEGGRYRIRAIVSDDEGRPNQTELEIWVSGGERPPARDVEQEEVTLIPDKKEYQPGDVAEILVQAPFAPAEGLLTLRRSGIVHSERFTMDEASYTLRVPIEEWYTPNMNVQVDLVGSAPRTDDEGQVVEDLPPRPAYAVGMLTLPIPPLSRTLSLEVMPAETRLEPGGTTNVGVLVRDAEGNPVEGAELAFAVVDEAVLALTSYQLADPIDVFYRDRSPDTQDHHLRSTILLANPLDLLGQGMDDGVAQKAVAEETLVEREYGLSAEADMGAPMMPAATAAPAEAAPGAGQEPIAVRADFNPLAAFEPAVPTDADGHATIEITLPDNLTRYRVMVVAVAGGKHFGKGESDITARLPLMVRASPPRFLNFGDTFELPIVLQNQTDEAMVVDVAVRASNIELTEGDGRQVTVPANDRVEVRIPASTERAGTARFQVAASAGPWADASQFSLPVWTPATSEAFAVYGQIDEGGVVQPVVAPSDVYPQFGGLEITTSSTALQELTDAVLYLVSYPFECSEQLASRILAIAALRDVLSAFQAEGLPSPEEIEAAVARDIERLRGIQNDDGGFPIWRRGQESWPFHSIHVAHALQRAKMKGYEVPEPMLPLALPYLRDIEAHIPSTYSETARRTLVAYALYTRKLMGDPDPAKARDLIARAGLEGLSFEAIGWLLPVLSDDPRSTTEVEQIRRYLTNRVTETAGAAHFVTSYSDEDYVLLSSSRRVDGILLDALIGDQPESDLIPKLVRGLLDGRKAGRWHNTQENVFILLAMDRYFNTYEAQTPDFVARVWLGEAYAGEAEFHGRSTDYKQIDVPMAYLAEVDGEQDLTLVKEGAGRLYYRLGLRYAPTDLELEPADYGFTVERTYEAVDDPEDVTRDEDGLWHVKAGARVRVRLTMVATSRRYHVALVDPLPAGFEALNPALAVTGSLPEDPEEDRGGWWWWWRWYEHQNLRDERAEAFTSLLWDGVYTYSYVARATTPGEFIVPPAKAEEMYAPETFGRTGTDRVVVE